MDNDNVLSLCGREKMFFIFLFGRMRKALKRNEWKEKKKKTEKSLFVLVLF